MPDWGHVLQEIAALSEQGRQDAIDVVRKKYSKALEQLTGRNTIAYFSGWLSKPGVQLLGINDEDMNAFMLCIHGMDRSKGLDLILHTPGGNIAATERIVCYLHQMFDKNIRAIVPQIAMSAGTMIACSTREILLGKHSSLGPIDPQIRDIPAQGVLDEFKQALREIKTDPQAIDVWRPILEKYHPTFLGQCKQAIDWTAGFVRSQLCDVMFEGDPNGTDKAGKIVVALSDTDTHKAHERHILPETCIGLGLKIKRLEDDQALQDAVLTVHHCFNLTLSNTFCFKIIENHDGVGIQKQQMQQVPIPFPIIQQRPRIGTQVN